MAKSSIIKSRNATPKPTNQPFEVGRVSTMELILSVTEPNVYPGSITGARSSWIGSAMFLTALRFQFRIRVPNVGQVRGAGPRVQIAQQAVVPRLRFQFRNPAVGIINVAENNRIRRTRLLARGLQFAVLNLALFALGINAMLVDALYAVSTLFHDAAAAHGHVRIAHHLVLRSLPVLEQQKIKPPHFVGTVVRAVAGAHT